MAEVIIDVDECIGCEACVEVCPEVFAFNDDDEKAYVIEGSDADADLTHSRCDSVGSALGLPMTAAVAMNVTHVASERLWYCMKCLTLRLGGTPAPWGAGGGLPEADLAQRPLYEVSWSMCAGCAEKPRFGVRGALPRGVLWWLTWPAQKNHRPEVVLGAAGRCGQRMAPAGRRVCQARKSACQSPSSFSTKSSWSSPMNVNSSRLFQP